jgi:AhpC/TSA family
MLRRAPVVGEEDEPEADLRDEKRLCGGKEMRDDAARLGAPVVRPAGERGGAERRGEDEKGDGVMDTDQGALDVAVRRGTDDLHRMRRRDRGQLVVVDVASPECRGEVVEVADHRSGNVDVELAARQVAGSERVARSLRDEEERPRPAEHLVALDVHEVLALEDIERLGAVVVHVHRRTESGRLGRLEHRHDAAALAVVRLDRHGEPVAEVDHAPAVDHRREDTLRVMVEEGKPAPDFELRSDSGETVRLSEPRGKPVVLYFYPKDDTTGL